MPLVIDDAFLPATLSSAPMTDEQFAEFCSDHPDLRIEMTAEGELIVMPPVHTETSDRNSEIDMQLRIWAKKDARGRTYDSNGLFVLPNGARRSPDACWIQKSRIQQLSRTERKGFYHLCPDFVIELRSDSDRLCALKRKMAEYMANGAQLGWLIDPDDKSVTIYRPDAEAKTRRGIAPMEGEGPVAGFVLELAEIWDPEID